MAESRVKNGDTPASDLKPCFVIAPIGDDGTPTRKRSDQVFRHIIEPVAQEQGYDAIRADHISDPGLITSQVIDHLLNDPLVIADLSEHNPNVFYELAVRHAVHKPVIQLCQASDKLPFDVSNTRTIRFDHTDLDSVVAAKGALKSQIIAAGNNDAVGDNPISIAINVQALQRSENPADQTSGEMMRLLLELKSEVYRLGEPRRSRDPIRNSPRVVSLITRELERSYGLASPASGILAKDCLDYLEERQLTVNSRGVQNWAEGVVGLRPVEASLSPKQRRLTMPHFVQPDVNECRKLTFDPRADSSSGRPLARLGCA